MGASNEGRSAIILSDVKEFSDGKYYIGIVARDLGEEFAVGDKIDRMLKKGRIGAYLYKVRSPIQEKAISKCEDYCKSKGLNVETLLFEIKE